MNKTGMKPETKKSQRSWHGARKMKKLTLTAIENELKGGIAIIMLSPSNGVSVFYNPDFLNSTTCKNAWTIFAPSFDFEKDGNDILALVREFNEKTKF